MRISDWSSVVCSSVLLEARPLQVVQRRVPLPFSVQTWPSFVPARLQALLAEDQARGFELERAPLVRLTLIRIADDDAYLVSSFHHLLVDGWCLGRLEREVRAAYESYRSRQAPLFDAIVPYRSYISWLEQTDHANSKAYFSGLLQGLPEHRPLFAPASQAAHSFITQRHVLDKQASRALTAFARRRGLTFGAVMPFRSEEHTSELQSLMRLSYAVFCLTKKKNDLQ